MYLRRIHVKHLKLLRDFELTFGAPDGDLRMWTAIIGENGTAKTSLLQAIALAAAGPALVNALATPVVAHLRDRRGTGSLEIEADFEFTPRLRGHREYYPLLPSSQGLAELRLRSRLELAHGSSSLVGASTYIDKNGVPVALPKRGDPLDIARSRSLPLWFVAGYGVSRFLPSPAEALPLNRPGIERMDSLFGSGSRLMSLRFLDHFDDEKARTFTKLLRDTLVRTSDLVPDLAGIELRGSGGVTHAGDLIDKDRFELKVGDKKRKVPAVALSHGYQSTIAWIADLLGHVMLEANTPVKAHEIEGLVLVDEIDLYLHPRWQVGLIGALRKTFPKVQFIVTTHSPVVLSAMTPHEIVRVKQHPQTGNVERAAHDPESGELRPISELDGKVPVEPDPRGMTGTDLYRDWFGVDRLTLNPHGKELRRYTQLAGDPFRSSAEDEEMKKLHGSLSQHGFHDLKPPKDRT